MSFGWNRASIAVLVALAMADAACSREKKEPVVVVEGPRTGIKAPAPATADSEEPVARPSIPLYTTTLPSPDAAHPMVMVTRKGAGSEGTDGAAPDPDLLIVDAARTQAAGCFARLPPHAVGQAPQTRTASLAVTVVPTGRVTRTQVQASGPQGGAAEPELSDCLRRVGDGLTFTSKEAPNPAGKSTSALGGDLRSFTIDVTVSSKH